MRSRIFNLVWGVSLSIIGVILLGNSLNLWFVDIFFNGWFTLFVIVPSLICVCINKFKLFNLVLLIISIFVFNLYRNPWSFKLSGELLLSLFILIVGGRLISFSFRRIKNNLKEEFEGDNVVFNGFFGSFNEKFNKRELGLVKINMFFSKINLDINSSTIKKDGRMKIINIFGFVKISGANNVNVEVSGSNVCSLIKNGIKSNNGKSPTLYIDSISIFGGIKIQK